MTVFLKCLLKKSKVLKKYPKKKKKKSKKEKEKSKNHNLKIAQQINIQQLPSQGQI
jgi:hypothetical protein